MKKINFYDLNFRSFGDGFCNENLSIDENVILASIIYLSQMCGAKVDRKELQFFSSSLGSSEIRDEYFEDSLLLLEEKMLIEVYEDYVIATKKLYDCIEEKYGHIVI